MGRGKLRTLVLQIENMSFPRAESGIIPPGSPEMGTD